MFEFINTEKAGRIDLLFGHLYQDAELHLAAGKLIYKEGGRSEHVFLIRSGEVLLFKKDKDLNHYFLGSKTKGFLGISSLFINPCYSHTAVTKMKTVIYKIPASEFRSFMMNNLHLYKDFLLPIAGDISAYEKRMVGNFNI